MSLALALSLSSSSSLLLLLLLLCIDVPFHFLPSTQFPRGRPRHVTDSRPGEIETQHGSSGLQARLEEAAEKCERESRRGGIR